MEPTFLVQFIGVFIAAGSATKLAMNGIKNQIKSVDKDVKELKLGQADLKDSVIDQGERLARVETCVEFIKKE